VSACKNPGMVSKSSSAGAMTPGPSRLPVAFDDKTRQAQIVAAVVGPIVLGVVSGLALGWTAVAYWIVQVIAILGGVLAGLEHHGARAGALRGLVGGFLFGAAILVVHYATGWHEHVSLGDVPAFLIVITTVAGAVLSAVGGAVRS